MICDNSDNIKHVQKDVFKVIQSHAEYLPCEQIPILDLSFWKACCDEKGRSKEVRLRMVKSRLWSLHK